ncbi:MAG TPA: hypothetical protein VJ742_12335 [Nitrososphaera sp.]|nr:hypothetical protein [Nitrososphaera sp.]
MAATVIINRLTGSGPTKTAITNGNTRLSYSDAASPGTNDPVVVPTSGTNRSWWATTRLECTAAPSNLINNIKWYSDGSSFGTGLTCVGNTSTGYTQATGSGGAGTSGTTLNTTNYSTLAGAPADVTTHTSGSPKSVSGSTSTAQEFGDRFVFQLEVTSTASPGTTTARTFTWQFDET